MMGAAPDVILLNLEPAAKQFITAVTEEQTRLEAFAFFDLVSYLAGVLVFGCVIKFDAVESPKLRQSITPLLHFDAVEPLAALDAHAARHHRGLGLFLPFKSDLADLHF